MDSPMTTESDSIEQLMTEIKTMRQLVTELTRIDQRCRQAEVALKAFKERNQLPGDDAPLGILTIDSQGGITGITRKMLEVVSWLSGDDPTSMKLSDCQAMVASGIFADIQRCID